MNWIFIIFVSINWEVYTNHKVVYDMASDENYLYLGTNGGFLVISPENGKLIKKYTHIDGLPANIVRAVEIDKKQRVWIGTDRGLAVYEKDKIIKYPTEKMAPQKITSISIEDSIVAVGTENGVYIIKPKEKIENDVVRFVYEGLIDKEIISIVVHKDTVWAGTNKGVSLITLDYKVHKNFTTYPADTMINDMLVYNDTLFILTPKALSYFSGDEFKIIVPVIIGRNPQNPWEIGKMERISNDLFYIGTEHKTILVNLKEKTVKLKCFFYSHGKPIHHLETIYKDENGVWFGWFRWGDYKYSAGKIPTLFLLKGKEKYTYDFSCIPSNGVNQSLVDSKGDIWSANCIVSPTVLPYGLGHYVSNTFWERYDKAYNEGIIGTSVWQIEIDSKDRLYLGHRRAKEGLVRFDFNENELRFYKWDSLSISNIVYSIGIDKYDRVWVYRWGEKELDVFDSSFSLIAVIPWKYGFTHRIVFDDSSLWAATDEGIIQYIPEDFEKNIEKGSYNKWDDSQGIPTKEVVCVAVGKDGKIWGATKQGGFCLNPENNIVTVINEKNLTWVAIDNKGKVYFLERFHGLSIYDPFVKKWEYYHKENSGIVPADEYIHLFIDTLFNRILISTPGWGLSVLKISPPKITSPDSIYIYPNPFYGENKRIVFKNIPSNAKILIYSISGKLIKKINPPSPDVREVVWFPHSLSSGIYIIVVISPQFKKVLKLTVLE